jgi:two-component system OmpR family sensor kinase
LTCRSSRPRRRTRSGPRTPWTALRSSCSSIIENLVDNAIRYGGERGAVTIRTRGREREAIVDVVDHGPGISAADRDRIFEAFFRVRSDAEAPGGSGLGLAIVSELAERNGGTVEVETAPGDGARFSVRFSRFR